MAPILKCAENTFQMHLGRAHKVMWIKIECSCNQLESEVPSRQPYYSVNADNFLAVIDRDPKIKHDTSQQRVICSCGSPTGGVLGAVWVWAVKGKAVASALWLTVDTSVLSASKAVGCDCCACNAKHGRCHT